MKGLIRGLRLTNKIRSKIFSLSQLRRLIRNGKCRIRYKMSIRFKSCKKCNRIIIRNRELINKSKIIKMMSLRAIDKSQF
jgi:hypothetical protein